jgi:hypothetical protein
MAYTLKNTVNGETYRCEDSFWLDIIKKAIESGWLPQGTKLSLENEIESTCDEMYGKMYNLYLVLAAHARCLEWDGNYTDKENQIVSTEDASNMLEELIYLGINPDFLDFIAKGSFEIGSD